MRTGWAALILVALPLAGGASGCGDGHEFTASEFIDRINAEGVAIHLGRPLPASGGADQLYAVRLPPLPGEPPPPAGSESGPGASGSLYVFGDSAAAGKQLDACRNAGGLGCYQAANIVVVLDEEGGALEGRRLAVAVQRLGK